MCLMCEGWSEDEVNALLDERICSFGWTTMGVADRPGQPTWMYTIGLAIVGHPELLIATVAPERAAESSAISPIGSSARASDSTPSTRRRVSTAHRCRAGRPPGPRRAGPRGRRPEVLPLGRSPDAALPRSAGRAPRQRVLPLPRRQPAAAPPPPRVVRHRRPQSGRTPPYGPPPSGVAMTTPTAVGSHERPAPGRSGQPGEPVEDQRPSDGDVQARAPPDHRDLHHLVEQGPRLVRHAVVLVAEQHDRSLARGVRRVSGVASSASSTARMCVPRLRSRAIHESFDRSSQCTCGRLASVSPEPERGPVVRRGRHRHAGADGIARAQQRAQVGVVGDPEGRNDQVIPAAVLASSPLAA